MSDDFCEDDEPLDHVVRAFERGIKGITTPPRGRNLRLDFDLAPVGPYIRPA